MARWTGWLLEHEDHRTGHRWLRAIKYAGDVKGTVEWTDDSNLALRFARRIDAVDFAWLFPEMCTLALITEHVWEDGAALETVALCPHGMPLAENTCGPCSEGRPNAQPEPDLGFGVAILRSMARAHMRDGASQEEAIANVAEYGELRSEAIEALRSALNRGVNDG